MQSKKEDPSSPVPQSPLTPEEDLAARMRALSMFERRVKPVEIGIELSRSTDEGQRLRTAYASLFDFCGKTLDQSLRYAYQALVAPPLLTRLQRVSLDVQIDGRVARN